MRWMTWRAMFWQEVPDGVECGRRRHLQQLHLHCGPAAATRRAPGAYTPPLLISTRAVFVNNATQITQCIPQKVLMLSRKVDECFAPAAHRWRRSSTALQRRKLKLKVKFESGPSYFSFKRLDPGAFNMGFIGSTCTALPRRRSRGQTRAPTGSSRWRRTRVPPPCAPPGEAPRRPASRLPC